MSRSPGSEFGLQRDSGGGYRPYVLRPVIPGLGATKTAPQPRLQQGHSPPIVRAHLHRRITSSPGLGLLVEFVQILRGSACAPGFRHSGRAWQAHQESAFGCCAGDRLNRALRHQPVTTDHRAGSNRSSSRLHPTAPPAALATPISHARASRADHRAPPPDAARAPRCAALFGVALDEVGAAPARRRLGLVAGDAIGVVRHVRGDGTPAATRHVPSGPARRRFAHDRNPADR